MLGAAGRRGRAAPRLPAPALASAPSTSSAVALVVANGGTVSAAIERAPLAVAQAAIVALLWPALLGSRRVALPPLATPAGGDRGGGLD